MTYPTDYNPAGLYPEIKIYSYGDLANAKYTWRHPSLPNPQQDFSLTQYTIKQGINGKSGHATISIEDHENNLTQDADSKIIRGDIIKIRLGKTSSTLTNYFAGVIAEPEIIRPGTNQQKAKLNAYGLLTILGHRNIDLNHTADTPLPASAKISELVKKIITDPTLEVTPSTDITISTTGVEDIDIRLSNFQQHNKSKKAVIDELSIIGDVAYGIDNQNFFFRNTDESDNYLVTNDLTAIHDYSKISYIRNKPYAWHTVLKSDYANVGIGYRLKAIRPVISQTTKTSQVQFGELLIKLDGIDDTFDSFSFGMRGSYGSAGNPAIAIFNEFSIISKSTEFTAIPSSRNTTLALIPPFTDWTDYSNSHASGTDITVKYSLTDAEKDFWKSRYKSDTFYALYIRGVSTPYYPANHAFLKTEFPSTNKNGLYSYRDHNGTTQSGETNFVFSLYVVKDTDIYTYNTTELNRRPQREIITDYNGQNLEYAEALELKKLQSLSRQRRIYTPISVSTPTTKPKLGKQITLYDSKLNVTAYPILIGYEITGNARNHLAPKSMDLLLEEWL